MTALTRIYRRARAHMLGYSIRHSARELRRLRELAEDLPLLQQIERDHLERLEHRRNAIVRSL